MDSVTLETILVYIDAHIHEKINLGDLADLAGYSPFYFSRLFSETMGMPVTGYIRIRKLQHAVASLLKGHKVIDVAFMYAFDSHEGFTRAFTQLFGFTPSSAKKHITSYTVSKYVMPIKKGRSNMDIINEKNLTQNMHQIAFVFLEQSLDEAKAGYCTEISVEILPDNKIKITDNGRGMPLSKDLHASKAVLDKILAGKPLTNSEYSQMGDLTQADLQTANSLCEALQIIVSRDGNQFQQDYIRGIAQHNLYISDSVRSSGTEVILKADTEIFGNISFSHKAVYDWLKDKSTGTAGLKISIQPSL